MAHKAEVIPALPEHIPHIAGNMRHGDVVELMGIYRTPKSSLRSSLNVSQEAWTGLIDGEPVCMFGVAPTSFLTPHLGRPWMLGTTRLDDHAILFLRRCKPQVKKMLRLFPVLENYVAASNVKAIDWLRWLGFEIDETPVVFRENVHFFKFRMEADHV